MKTSELTGDALDWAVTQARLAYPDNVFTQYRNECNYSTDWSQGGPIIEREEITVCWQGATWVGSKFNVRATDEYEFHQTGPTPLIAAMRCYVASKLGDEVDMPEETK